MVSFDANSPVQPPQGPSHAASGPRNRKLLFTVLGVIGVLLVATAVAVGFYAKSTIDGLNNIKRDSSVMPSGSRPESVAPVDDHSPINIVVMGSDSRGTDRGRSDVLQLLHISGDRSSVYLMSFPRDSYVDIPGHGKAKINAAYSWGGPALTIQTLEQLLGVPMDHTAIVNFDGFTKVINALGGITAHNNEASTSNGVTFAQGDIPLDGASALTFVRQRHGLSDGDFGRATRQREVIRAVAKKLASAGTLTDPAKFRDSVAELGANFTVDDGFTNDAIVNLGWQLRDFDPDNIKSFQVPTSGFDTTSDKQSVVVLNSAKLSELRTALRSDEMDTFYSSLG